MDVSLKEKIKQYLKPEGRNRFRLFCVLAAVRALVARSEDSDWSCNDPQSLTKEIDERLIL